MVQDSDGLIPVRIFQKRIDDNNNDIFEIVKRSYNECAEVRLDGEIP